MRNGRPAFTWPPDAVEYVLAHTPLTHAQVIPAESDGTPPRLTPYSSRFPDFIPQTLTTEDLGQAQLNGVFSQPRLDQNDWEGKDYRWFTWSHPLMPDLPVPANSH